MEKKEKYLCQCGGSFDKPKIEKEKRESYFTCPVCGTMIGLPGEDWK